jgi:hypothetical protein
VEDYCFVENTYYLPFERRIPTNTDERDEQMLNYYQWVPFVLALMALMFHIPHFVWRSINFLSGLSVRAVVSMAAEATNKDPEGRKDTVELTAAHMREAMKIQESLSSSANPLTWLMSCTTGHGWYIIICYVFTKLLFILNIVAQFYILLSFLGHDATFWGATILNDLANTKEWHENGAFPRVTLCDFNVRVLGNVQRFSVQCVLMINMFNEQIFLFLWWWFLFVAAVTCLSTLYWFAVCVIPGFKVGFIRKMLNTHDLPRERNVDKVPDFVFKYVRPDGAFVLRLMCGNAGELVTSQVVCKMWENYLQEEHKQIGFNDIGRFGEASPLPSKYPPPFSKDEADSPPSSGAPVAL